jgi:hypothetical protein
MGHMLHMGDMRNRYIVLVGKSLGRGHFEDLRVYWRITLEGILGI